MPPTDVNVRDKLQTFTMWGDGGFQHNWLTFHKQVAWTIWNKQEPLVIKNEALIEQYVKEVMEKYDFLAVAERTDESLVALQLLLGLHAGDILYISAKTAGGYDDGWSGKCIKIQSSFISPAIQQFFNSREWFVQNSVDFLLHAVANKSLDLTIERIGKERFQRELERHKQLLAIVHEKCAMQAKFPCDQNGVLHTDSQTDCYWNDSGCGHSCIDTLLNAGQLDDIITM